MMLLKVAFTQTMLLRCNFLTTVLRPLQPHFETYLTIKPRIRLEQEFEKSQRMDFNVSVVNAISIFILRNCT